MISAVIDRFEEDKVVLLVGEDEQKVVFPKNLLDENLNVSSVPSYDKDKENVYLETQNYFKEYNSGKSNVELLSKISLIEHTINVAQIAIKEFTEIEKKWQDNWLPKAP